jgi:twitching motility protein PilT
MINYINTNYSRHIITIEDPIEYVHKHKKSIVEHKEVGKDVPNYETALM